MRIEKERLILKMSNGLASKSEVESILLLVVRQAANLMEECALKKSV